MNSGIGLGGVLFVVFLVLKLVGVIAWSWWWITAPLWIPIAVVLGVVAVTLIIGGVCALVGHFLYKKWS